MSTPRQITASEVRKGMTIRAEWGDDCIHTSQGKVHEVIACADERTTMIVWDDGASHDFDPDGFVTVLADPEPEWVEGAWYRVEIDRNSTIAKRVEGGWVRWDGPAYPSWEDVDRSRRVTVLGRVLIVDWPGDDVAKGVVRFFPEGGKRDFIVFANMAAAKVADAIRTQGGIR